MKAGNIVQGRYRIEESLGRGGMGEVFLAHDRELDKQVALKTLLPEAMADLRSADQLRR